MIVIGRAGHPAGERALSAFFAALGVPKALAASPQQAVAGWRRLEDGVTRKCATGGRLGAGGECWAGLGGVTENHSGDCSNAPGKTRKPVECLGPLAGKETNFPTWSKPVITAAETWQHPGTLDGSWNHRSGTFEVLNSPHSDGLRARRRAHLLHRPQSVGG